MCWGDARPRISSALRQLTDLGQDPGPQRWRWDIVRVETSGRLVLPAAARAALGTAGQLTSVFGSSSRIALMLRRTGGGAAIVVDRRGRLSVPAWLRHASSTAGVVLVGVFRDPAIVLIASTGVLDGLGDLLAGELR